MYSNSPDGHVSFAKVALPHPSSYEPMPRFAAIPAWRRIPRFWKATGVALLFLAFTWWQHSKPTFKSVSASSPPPPTTGLETNVASKKTGPRIAIVTFVTDEKSYTHISLRNKQHYVNRHGYDLFVDYESHARRGTTWHKFNMVERIIEAGQHDWVWWMDFDTLITNTTIKLTDVIEEGLASAAAASDVNFLITDDCNGINDGSFIVSATQRSLDIFQEIRNTHDREEEKSNPSINDQDCMGYFLKSDHPLVAHMQYIPQYKINAFPEEIKCPDQHKVLWEYGTFVIHFAGAWAHVDDSDATGLLMRKYKDKIIWGRSMEVGKN